MTTCDACGKKLAPASRKERLLAMLEEISELAGEYRTADLRYRRAKAVRDHAGILLALAEEEERLALARRGAPQ